MSNVTGLINNLTNMSFEIVAGVYREVRCITPEDQLTNWSPSPSPHHKGYIVLGFKSLDNSFNKVRYQAL